MTHARYSQLSKILFLIFLACSLFWIPRISRKSSPEIFEPIFNWSNTEMSVLFEHFAAGLGLPALITSIFCSFVCNFRKSEMPNGDLRSELSLLFTAFVSIICYSVGEAGHEAMQLTLAKRSNFGQFLKDYCIPAQTISSFGDCSKQYWDTVKWQFAADAFGMLTFVCILMVVLYRFKRNGAVL